MSTIDPQSLGEALFPKARLAVIGLLFGHPDESYYLREIAELTGLAAGHVQRELGRLTEAGVLLRTRRGRSVFFQANPACPIFDELRGIALKTAGVVVALRRALAPLRERIHVAFVFGSVARGEQRAESDVDLMLIGDVTFAEVVACIRPVEAEVNREVNPVIYSRSELRSRLAQRNHFLTKVLASEKLLLLGDEDELATLSGQ